MITNPSSLIDEGGFEARRVIPHRPKTKEFTMISVAEAIALYDDSGAEVQNFLKDNVDLVIRDAAKNGKRFAFIHCGCEPIYMRPSPNVLQQRVMDELKNLGYTIGFGPYGASYVPLGLVDSYDKRSDHCNYGIHVTW